MSHRYSYGYYGGFAPYVSVAERKQKAAKHGAKLQKQGVKTQPVIIEGRTIAKTYWGKAWCDNLESYSDYENRLPRGRSYTRNGLIVDLKIEQCKVTALVSGSSLYEVTIDIEPLVKKKWKSIVQLCAGKIDSLIELLQGKFSRNVMEIIARKEQGLFPHPSEIKFKCSCPDHASMCKHVAAAFYGIGARFDEKPELLFLLREVDHCELITNTNTIVKLTKTKKGRKSQQILQSSELSEIFGIEIDEAVANIANKTSVVKSKPTKKTSKVKTKAAKKVIKKTTRKTTKIKIKPKLKKQKTKLKAKKTKGA